MTEIGSGVWVTPANFNGFCNLAALLHGILVVGVSQTAALNRGRHVYSAITFGIGPHSSLLYCQKNICSSACRRFYWTEILNVFIFIHYNGINIHDDARKQAKKYLQMQLSAEYLQIFFGN